MIQKHGLFLQESAFATRILIGISKIKLILFVRSRYNDLPNGKLHAGENTFHLEGYLTVETLTFSKRIALPFM